MISRQPHRLLTACLLLAALLAAGGCLNCPRELAKAQNLFKEAYQGQVPGSPATPQQQDKYRQAMEQLEKNFFPHNCPNDLQVQAYAIEAYSQWRLGNYPQAMDLARKGQALYERAGKATTPRDYGLLLILPGYAMHSQAHWEYEARVKQGGNLSPAEARQFDRKMASALKAIDLINSKLGSSEEIVIRANQDQLRLVLDIINVWDEGTGDLKVSEPEVRRWLARGDEIAKKFPPGDYDPKLKATTQELLEKLARIKKTLPPTQGG